MQSPNGLVVGTAGHIDHGKTSLVRALTGIDTDRLAEEKKRGISIDLGFAHMALPAGERISFIDVPGHERFIKNMLAGVAGIDAVLLIVAADESVKPQTREHFEICRLLGIQRGIVVLTKVDLASADQIASAKADVAHLVAGSFLENAPVVSVSAKTRQGFDDLKQQLAALSKQIERRDASGFARLPIDRSFALKGFGTVVTGTLGHGKLHVGDAVLIHPIAREVRVRGLQVHGRAVQEATAGERTAVNLAGIDHAEIRRGFTLTSKAGIEPTNLLDAQLEWLREEDAPLSRREIFVHLGTAEVVAEVKVIMPGEPYARIWLAEQVLAFPGDRLILRRPSPAETIAGGFVVEVFPKRRMNRTRVVARLQTLSKASLGERLQWLVQESGSGQTLAELVRVTGADPETIKSAVAGNPALSFIETSQRAVSTELLERKRRELIQWLAHFHAANPAASGAPIAQARRTLDPAFADAVIDHDSAIVIRGDLIALTAHKPRVSSGEMNALAQLERAFREAGFQPPLVNEILKKADPDPRKARGLLEALIKSGRLVRLSPDLVYHAEVIDHVRKSLAQHKGRKFSVPEFKEWTQISRKFAIPLLEYLDRVHVTKRDGDSRIVL
ncbi:MAG: selenocysteine-specific translation elongation factor [Acidobacteriaceae bacterium]|nr:selenocysteine-specific translation elongation factor [Acidobacteriaceae bacterium]